MSENLPRFTVYQRLQENVLLQVSLLDMFSDVVEFSVLASQYIGYNAATRIFRQLQRPFDRTFGQVLQRIDSHSRAVDKTAVAVELLQASEYRKVQQEAASATLKLQIEGWLQPANMRAVHQYQIESRLSGTCEWIWINPVFQE